MTIPSGNLFADGWLSVVPLCWVPGWVGAEGPITMDRRSVTVLGVSLVFALVVSSVFYQMTPRRRFTQPHAIPYSTQASIQFEQQLQSLVQGHVLFNPPDTMQVG